MLQNQNFQAKMFKNRLRINLLLFSLLCGLVTYPTLGIPQETAVYDASKSVARNWNNALLTAIRLDFARPTVHARNLFHTAAAMYDALAVFSEKPVTYFLGSQHEQIPSCIFSANDKLLFHSQENLTEEQRQNAINTAISYASFRLLNHRFSQSPGADASLQRFTDLFNALGHDLNNNDLDIQGATPNAALGNRIAACVIAVGNADGSNEANNYVNQRYQPVNTPLNPIFTGTPGLVDPNRWQPLQLDSFIDQSGNLTDTPIFLGAEWGQVTPFALQQKDLTLYNRDDTTYPVYHDPGAPALLTNTADAPTHYQWGHSLVAIWSSHLDPSDGVMWDISPASIGNSSDLPTDLDGLRTFYRRTEGGSTDQGHAINPVTNSPYVPQLVPRGDYTRVLAEFWADGPQSETPPGHWFEIFNKAVSDHPAFEKRFAGAGPILDDLTFDIYAYFILGGAMHDSAISAWGIKGWYDYIRPISALRYLASLGQNTDITATNYHLQGIPLEPGYIESVDASDILAGNGGRNIGKIKVLAWRGPTFIINPDSDSAGVDWILLDNWWPYQRPTFVTPPFAGYISGHSTFSRAAAEVLARITGDEYFPGGMGEFVAKKNEFLVFEDGPSVDITLQWATFKDASDQTSLSRIWGGIHPPVDDIPGRRIGITVGTNAFNKALSFFDGTAQISTGSDGSDTTTASSGGRGSVGIFLFALIALSLLLRRALTGGSNPRLKHGGDNHQEPKP